MDDFLDDKDKEKLAQYSQYLDTNDPKQNLANNMQQDQNNMNKAVDIAARGPFQERTPEEQQFADKQLGPMLQGLIGGGTMGSVNKVGQEIKPAFNRLQQMMQVGGIKAPVNNAAQALQVKDALQNAGQVLPGQFGRVIRKY